MVTGKFDPHQFFHWPSAVAALAAPAELFSLLRRTFDLPAAWAGLVRRTAGDSEVVPPGGLVRREDADDILLVRTTPFEVEIDEPDVVTRDHFQCRVNTQLTVRLLPERGEMLSLLKTIIGSGRAATIATIARYLQPSVRQVLVDLAAKSDAEALVDGSGATAAGEALIAALRGPCFAGGMTLEGAPVTRFDSPMYVEVRRAREQAERQASEQEAAQRLRDAVARAQREHLDHLTGLLTRLREMATASPGTSIGDLIRTFDEHQRGEIYEALFAQLPVGPPTRWVAVVTDDELLLFDPKDLNRPQLRVRAGSGAAGKVRSVRFRNSDEDGAELWLGAATGVYRLRVGQMQPDTTLLTPPGPPVRGGFNSVAVAGRCVFASHSELGVFAWLPDESAIGRPCLESMTHAARAVRGIAFLAGDLYCAVDDRVVRWHADDTTCTPTRIYAGSHSEIRALHPLPTGLLAGNRDGDVLRWTDDATAPPQRLHTGRGEPAEAVIAVESGGVPRVLFTDNGPYVFARVLDDTFTRRYEAAVPKLRRVAAAPDAIVALSELRDRIVFWDTTQPDAATVVNIGALCGETVQDVCLVPDL